MKQFKFEKEGRGTDYWVKRLARNSMPVAGNIIVELNKLSEGNEGDLNNLAELILRDPNLTSHVLRVANSIQYNISEKRTNTVSRAIVMIGLKGMRALCISLMLIDSLLKNGAKQRMLEIMAQSFHAATQARAYVACGDAGSSSDAEAAEEVFIAALLYNFGEMAYWASNDLSAQNQKFLKGTQAQRNQAVEQALGTSFNRITGGLAKQWKLGQTLEEALASPKVPSAKAKAVLLGEKISRAALDGWNSPRVNKLLEEITEHTDETTEACLKKLKARAEEALDIAKQFGAANVCCMIPGPDHAFIQEEPALKARRIMQCDPQLQLNILRELTATAAEKHNVNTVFQMVIEGIHRGVGMERVAIAFIKDFRAKAKHSLGYGAEHWKETFDFDVGPFADNVIAEAVDKGGFLWADTQFYRRHKNVRPKDTVKVLGEVDSLIFVFEVNGKKPGLIYADRADFGGLITQNHADSFHHFATQAQYCLQNITLAKR